MGEHLPPIGKSVTRRGERAYPLLVTSLTIGAGVRSGRKNTFLATIGNFVSHRVKRSVLFRRGVPNSWEVLLTQM
jgi:hypothetical protein